MNHIKLGKLIRKVDGNKNKQLKDLPLLGINIDKEFMPSVANTIGTDMSNYQIVKMEQFACNPMHLGRDERMPTALLLNQDEILFSPAYFVFEVIDKNVILPEYLMLYFKQPETDRLLWFKTDSSVRGGLGWNELCDIEIPVPDLQVQKDIIRQYNQISDAIKIKEKLNNNLEQQAQAIFYINIINNIDSENWEVSSLTDIANYLNGLAMQNYRPSNHEKSYPVLKIRELRQGYCDFNSDLCSSSNIDEEYIIKNNDVIFSWSGSLLVDIWSGGTCGLNQHLFKVTSNKYEDWFYYYWTKHHLNNFIRIAEGKATSLGHIKREELDKAVVLIPPIEHYNKINRIISPIFNSLKVQKIEKIQLMKLQSTLLPKLMLENSDSSTAKLSFSVHFIIYLMQIKSMNFSGNLCYFFCFLMLINNKLSFLVLLTMPLNKSFPKHFKVMFFKSIMMQSHFFNA